MNILMSQIFTSKMHNILKQPLFWLIAHFYLYVINIHEVRCSANFEEYEVILKFEGNEFLIRNKSDLYMSKLLENNGNMNLVDLSAYKSCCFIFFEDILKNQVGEMTGLDFLEVFRLVDVLELKFDAAKIFIENVTYVFLKYLSINAEEMGYVLEKICRECKSFISMGLVLNATKKITILYNIPFYCEENMDDLICYIGYPEKFPIDSPFILPYKAVKLNISYYFLYILQKTQTEFEFANQSRLTDKNLQQLGVPEKIISFKHILIIDFFDLIFNRCNIKGICIESGSYSCMVDSHFVSKMFYSPNIYKFTVLMSREDHEENRLYNVFNREVLENVRELSLKPLFSEDEYIDMSILKEMPSLEVLSLEVPENTSFNSAILSFTKSTPTLRHITFKNVTVKKSYIQFICESKSIKTISFVSCYIDEQDFIMFLIQNNLINMIKIFKVCDSQYLSQFLVNDFNENSQLIEFETRFPVENQSDMQRFLSNEYIKHNLRCLYCTLLMITQELLTDIFQLYRIERLEIESTGIDSNIEIPKSLNCIETLKIFDMYVLDTSKTTRLSLKNLKMLEKLEKIDFNFASTVNYDMHFEFEINDKCKIKNLSLNFSFDILQSIVKSILSNERMKKNVEHMGKNCKNCLTEEYITILSEYEKLTSLNLVAFDGKMKNIEKLLAFPNLQDSLITLRILLENVSESLLSVISSIKSLKSLEIHLSEHGFFKNLQRKEIRLLNLTRLKIVYSSQNSIKYRNIITLLMSFPRLNVLELTLYLTDDRLEQKILKRLRKVNLTNTVIKFRPNLYRERAFLI